jgi:hypothetical protein
MLRVGSKCDQLHINVMITIWINDYLVVMVYVNQYCLDTFACLE